MFDGGKQKEDLPQAQETSQGIDPSVRVFSMPEELRGKAAILQEEPKKEAAPEALAPLIIPVAIPAPAEQVVIRRRVSPVLLALLMVVLMGGTGAGVWWYVVTYASPPQIIETPPPDVTPPPGDETPTEPYPGTDTDSDGLTNVEELLYGTDFRSPDTDGDTFLDGNEVFHRYDPNGLAPSTLLDTGAVRVLERADIPFTMYYPASWSVDAKASSATLTFRSSDSASITLTYAQKDPLVALTSWLKQQDISTRDTEQTMTKEGYDARIANDGRTMYVDMGAWAVSATYDLGEDNYSIDFLQTFKMMTNSIVTTEAADDTAVVSSGTSDAATATDTSGTTTP